MSDIPGRIFTGYRDRRLGRLDLCVLGFLHQWLTAAEFRRIKVAVVAHEVFGDPRVAAAAAQWQHQSVAKSIRHLVQLGYLDRGPYDDRLRTYKLATPAMRVVTRDTTRAA